jgi:hypothetical protein
MPHEYDLAVHAFTDMEHFSLHELEAVVVKFFKVKEQIYHSVEWAHSTRSISFVLLYLQYLQLIFYFNAHPRMAILYQTMVKCFQDMAHFLFLFSVLFFFLSYMAYFQFGDLLPGHATFLKSSISQFRMIFGEFIYDEEADALTSSQYLLYWAYSGTFMIVAFFILLNFFLAIVVDNFMLVKEDVKEFNAENNIWVDVWDIAESFWKYRKYKWPDRATVINFLNARGDEGPEKSDKSGVSKVMFDFLNGPPREFCEDSVKADEFLGEFQEFDEDSLVQYLTFYANKVDHDADMIVTEEHEMAEGGSDAGAPSDKTEEVPDAIVPAAAPQEKEPAIDPKQMNRAEIFAEVSAHCVEALAKELDGDADLSLEVAVGKLSFDMIRHLDKAERVLSAMYVDA